MQVCPPAKAKSDSVNLVLLWLVGMNPNVLEVVQKSPLGKVLGRDAMHFNLEIAVAKYLGTDAPAGSDAS